MRPAPSQSLVKSFGYGIFLVEMNPPPAEKTKPNGKKDVQQTEIYRSMKRSGMDFSEVVLDSEDEARAYAMASTGHEPTQYELALIEEEDWERIRTSVDLWGSQGFSDRLTMLEGHKPSSAEVTASP
jgi:hypothetical protein